MQLLILHIFSQQRPYVLDKKITLGSPKKGGQLGKGN